MEIPQLDVQPVAPKSLSDLAEKAKLVEKDSPGLMNPGEKAAPKKRGRPLGSTKTQTQSATVPTSVGSSDQPIQNQIATREIVLPFVKLTSKACGAYVGDKRAEMNHEELEAVARALGLVADKWMPVLGKDYGPEVLLATTLGAYGMRVVAMKKILDAEKEAMKTAPAMPKDENAPLAKSLSFPSELKSMDGPYTAQNLSI